MALTIKHAGRGKYQVLDGETVVAKGVSKEDAEAMASGIIPIPEAQADEDAEPAETEAEAGPGPIPTHAEDGRELTEAERRRLFEQRLEERTASTAPEVEEEPDTERPAEEPAAIPVRDAEGRVLSEAERRRLYEIRMNADRQVVNDRALAPYKAMVFKDFDQDTADAIWRQMEPILKAGAEGVRRNLGRNMRVRG